MWDDDRTREFLYIELRNISPFDVELRTDSYRIARYNAGKTPGVDVPDASVVFKTDPLQNNARNTIRAGRTFLIGCHDNSAIVTAGGTDQVRSSDFYVNDGSGTEFDQIVPFRIDGADTNEQSLPVASGDHPQPTLDLDLSYTGPNDHRNRFEFDNPAVIDSADPALVNPGETLLSTDGTWSGFDRFTLVLQRRTNLRTDGVINHPDTEDQWVEVDRFDEEQVIRQVFDASDAATSLNQLRSFERAEPLDRSSVAQHAATGNTPPRNHTLGAPDFVVTATADNSNTEDRNRGNSNLSTAEYTIWQPHFDRDFSSVFELLSVPVIGPHQLTERLVDQSSKRLTGWYDSSVTPKLPALAGARFLNVDPNGDSDPSSVTTLADDNRWYRLLEFLAVPDDGDDAIRHRLARIVRKPGKINLNTVRDETVLAAILDDQHIQRFMNIGAQTDDVVQGSGRNWYRELVLARDGVDPMNALNGGGAIPLPGVPGVPPDRSSGSVDIQYGAIPFRSLSYVAPNVSVWPNSRQMDKAGHTILRKHVTDDVDFTSRISGLDDLGLFEARPTTDSGTDAVDFHTRNRLLAKIANHTTNRSNVFAVWLTVGYFEAHQPDPVSNPSVVQIGGELAGSTRHRSFFVIDRTRLEEAVQVDENGIKTLNWRTFLLHRRTLPQ